MQIIPFMRPTLLGVLVAIISQQMAFASTLPPSQAGYGTQWWLNNPSVSQSQTHLSLLRTNESLGVDLARAEGLDGTGVKVAVLDTGINDRKNFGGVVDSTFGTGVSSDLHGDYVATVIADKNEGIASRATLIDARYYRPDALNDPSVIDASLLEASKQADIISFSRGYIYSEAVDTPENRRRIEPVVRALETAIIENGSLIIESTANDKFPNPKLDALAMVVNPELKQGWISVTAYNSQNDKTLASYANACGMAADFCMAAPGTYLAPTKNGTWTYIGTSFAVPRVSGAAALLKQKYPWASNDVLRTILLTTADDLGDRSKYGWGAINVASAIKGMKQLPFGELETNVTEGVYSFSNNISGTGSLKKTGVGTLNLDGTNTFAGGIKIDEGVLNINKQYTGNVIINNTGELGGVGSASNVFVQSGSINLRNGLKVGDLTLSDKAVTKLAANQNVYISGDAQLAGVVDIDNLDAIIAQEIPSKVETLLHIGGVQTGNFNNIVAPLMYSSNIDYQKNLVGITITRNPAQEVIKGFDVSSDALNVINNGAAKLDSIVGLDEKHNDSLNRNLSAIYNSYNSTELGKSLYSLGGGIYQNSLNAAILETANIHRAASKALRDLGASYQLKNEDGSGIFVQTEFFDSQMKPSHDLKADNSGHQVVLGAFFPLDYATVGLVMGKNQQKWSEYFNNEYMGASEIDSNGFGLHATTDVGPTTVGAYLGGYNIKNTVNRQIDTVSEISNAHAIQKAQLLQMGVSAGIEHKLKYGLVGLDAGGQIEHLKTKSFEESNNPLGLSEDDSNDSFGMVYANGRFKLPIAYNKPHFIQGELGVQHDLKQRNTMNTSWDVPRTRGLIGADFKFEITEGIYAAIGVKHNFSSTHKSTSGLLEVNMQF